MPRMLFVFGLPGILGLLFASGGCSPTSQGTPFEEGKGGSGQGGGSGSQGSQGSDTTGVGGGFNPVGTGTSTMSGANECSTNPNVDDDMDGFTDADGDCNDCDKNVNPGAIEVVVVDGSGGSSGSPPADEDCDGVVDNAPPTCDDNLDLDDSDPMAGARAIELCREATGNSWGVMSANYVRANGTPIAADLGVGILPSFGPNVSVQAGQRMLGLSSGHARVPGQPGACDNHECQTHPGGTPPPDFPAAVPNCLGGTGINDDVGLELKLRAPTNATGYKFLFKFYSFEFAEYVCTAFNDQFIALVDPPPADAKNGNIVFDSMNNPVSVNIAFFDVCDAAASDDFAEYCKKPPLPFFPPNPNCPSPPSPYCPSGPAELVGTGFADAFGSEEEDGGATSWLQTTAPVAGGTQFTIRFTIWDTGDSIFDSTTLVDGFEWIASGGTPAVATEPVRDPR